MRMTKLSGVEIVENLGTKLCIVQMKSNLITANCVETKATMVGKRHDHLSFALDATVAATLLVNVDREMSQYDITVGTMVGYKLLVNSSNVFHLL